MSRKWIAILLCAIAMFSLASQAFAASPSQWITTSCGVANNGTATFPHKICSQEDLKLMRTYPAHHFFLNNGIYVSPDWTPIPYFSGTFYGNRQSIAGLKDSLIQKNYGKITHLDLQSVAINRDGRGALASENYGYLYQVKAYGNINGYEIGGIAGFNYGVIEESSSFMKVTGSFYAGGIASYNKESGVINRSYFGGETYATTNSGGITAVNEGKIYDSIAWGTVYVYSAAAGGVSGQNWATGLISNSKAAGDVIHTVNTPTDVGHFVGRGDGVILNPIIQNQVLKVWW